MKKPKTQFEIDAVRINSKITETISVCDKNIIISSILKDKKLGDISKLGYIYFTITEQRKDLEICRLYRCYVYNNRKRGMNYIFAEVCRKFTKDTTSRFFSKKRNCMNWSTPWDSFSFGSEIELRSCEPDRQNYSICDLFELSQFNIRRHSGKRIECVRVNPDYLNKIIRIPYGETLYNAHEDKLIEMMVYRRTHISEVLPSIRIAKKHGFVFSYENIGLWFDMVDAIIRTKNDNHNPKFVSPDNINEMHNYFIHKLTVYEKKKRKQDLLNKEARDIQRIQNKEKKVNEDYIKRRRRFFDLQISNSLFDIYVLRDVTEFYQEGLEMEHCVFSCKYYEREKSLIMTCRNKNGERIETIEVDLTKFKVVQSYGKKDHFTPYHREIVKLVNSNMNKIRMCYYGRYKAPKDSTRLVQAV